MKSLAAFLLLAIATLASAQDAKRIEAIWAAVDERFSTQADAWFEDGEFPMTIQLLRMQADFNPHNYDIVTNLGWMLENIQENDQAVVVYQQYRRDNPKDPDATLPEAEHWFRRKQYPKVIELLKNLSDKGHANNFRILAHAFDRSGNLQESAKTWKRYVALNPNDLTAKANLARVEKKIRDGG